MSILLAQPMIVRRHYAGSVDVGVTVGSWEPQIANVIQSETMKIDMRNVIQLLKIVRAKSGQSTTDCDKRNVLRGSSLLGL